MSNQLSNGLLARRRRRATSADTLSLVTSVQSSTTSIICPSVSAGDLLLFSNAANMGGGAPSSVTPSGFTLINNQLAGAGTWYRHTIFYKIASGAEGGVSLSGMGGGSQLIGLGVFRKSSPILGVVVSAVNAEGHYGTLQLSNQAVLAGGGGAPLLVIGNYGIVTQAVSSGDMSPAPDGSYQSTNGVELFDSVKWKFYADAPVDALVSMDTTAYPSTNLRKSMRSFYLTLT